MHARAPHLDGRYTWFGAIVGGRKAADALVIGDRIERATIAPAPAAR
jgi:cyclophilin family peptidyl-prolyl cis-trans isomerase